MLVSYVGVTNHLSRRLVGRNVLTYVLSVRVGVYWDIQMFHASVEFNLCALLFFGALVEGNLR
jgi:hypothetical protein